MAVSETVIFTRKLLRKLYSHEDFGESFFACAGRLRNLQPEVSSSSHSALHARQRQALR
jgi:hypothetical protein